MQPLADQILSFLLVTLLGVILGVFYDCYRTIRQIWRPKAWGTILGDTLFWILSTVLAYLFLLFFTWGEVRFYVFLALASGVVLYLRFASRYISFLLLHAYLLCIQLLTHIFKLILLPFWLLWRIILIPCRFLTFIIVLVIKGLRQVKVMLRRVVTHWRRKYFPPPPTA